VTCTQVTSAERSFIVSAVGAVGSFCCFVVMTLSCDEKNVVTLCFVNLRGMYV